MDHPSPLVSVVTPAKNAAQWIQGAVHSVRDQTFQNWEMIIVDDGSNDTTAQAAAEAAEGDPRVHINSIAQSEGAGAARNHAITLARGRYIAFLDADDLWDTEKLTVQIAAMQEHQWVFSWTSYRVEVVKADGSMAPPPHVVRNALPQASRTDLLSKRAPIGCLTAVYDTAAFGKVYMVNLPKRQDFVLWAQLLERAEKEGWTSGGLEQPLATYRHRGDSLSSNKWDAARMQWRALVEHLDVGTLAAARFFASYAWRGVADRMRIQRK